MTKILNFINYKTNDLNFLKWKPDIIQKLTIIIMSI